MAARGGKSTKTKKTTLRIERAEPKLELPIPADELVALLNPLIERELASIGAIDTVTARESHPGYVMLLRAAKTGKQANVEQMASMIRFAGAQPAQTGTPVEAMLKLQSLTARRIGTTPMLRAMRFVQAELVHAYGQAYGSLDGAFQKGLTKCWHRAVKQLTILTAHIAMRGAKPELEEMLALPMTLDHYFANGEDRVCFRCLFDRPGKLAPIERADPNPYTYLCSACHDEILGDFPPDLLDSVYRWSESEREAHVVERALSRPSRLKAESLIHAKLSDVAPDLPAPPLPYKAAEDASPKRRAPAQPRPRVELGGMADSALEQAYSDALFDYESVRDNW